MRRTLLIFSLIFTAGTTHAQMEWSAQSQVSFGQQSNAFRTGVNLRMRDLVVNSGLRLALPSTATVSGPNFNGAISPRDWSEVPGFYVQFGIPIAVMPDSCWFVYVLADYQRFKGTYSYQWIGSDGTDPHGNVKVPYVATVSSEFFAVNLHALTEYRLNEKSFVFAGVQLGRSKFLNDDNIWVRSETSNFAFYFGFRYRFAQKAKSQRPEKL